MGYTVQEYEQAREAHGHRVSFGTDERLQALGFVCLHLMRRFSWENGLPGLRVLWLMIGFTLCALRALLALVLEPVFSVRDHLIMGPAAPAQGTTFQVRPPMRHSL